MYTCDSCGRDFGHRSNLSRHRAVCQLGESYDCVFCERHFDRKDNLKNHIKKRHFEEGREKETSTKNGPSGEKKRKTEEKKVSSQVVVPPRVVVKAKKTASETATSSQSSLTDEGLEASPQVHLEEPG